MSLLLLNSCAKQREKSTQPIFPVNVGVASQKDVPHLLKGVGQLAASMTVDIQPQVSGVIVDLLFSDGQEINEGDLLYIIDQQEYKTELDAARARLAMAKAKLKYAEEFTRIYGALVGKEYVARLDYEKGLRDIGEYSGEIDSISAEIRRAEITLGYTEIRSPVKGYAGIAYYSIGNIVDPPHGPVLTTIRTIVPLDVQFTLPSVYVDLLRQGQRERPLAITCYRPDDEEPLIGTVYGINNTVDPQTGMISLLGRIPNEDERGWPGEFVRVQTLVETLKDVTVIPSEGLVKTEGDPWVFVVKQDEAGYFVDIRKVKTGLSHNGETIILEGIKPGEMVVTNGKRQLKPQTRVRIEKA